MDFSRLDLSRLVEAFMRLDEPEPEPSDPLTHQQAFDRLKAAPTRFTDMPLDDRDLALINAPRVPDVQYSKQSYMSHLVRFESKEPHQPFERKEWTFKTDVGCKKWLAQAGQVLHGFGTRFNGAASRPELQKPLMVKMKIAGKPTAGFEWGVLTANGSCPGDIRIFKGPMHHKCNCCPPEGLDGMIVRNAVASSGSLHKTSLDRVWDVLLMKRVEQENSWLVCAMREVEEPGDRVVYRIRQFSNGLWGTDHCDGQDGCAMGTSHPIPDDSSGKCPPICIAPGFCPDRDGKGTQMDVPLVFG